MALKAAKTEDSVFVTSTKMTLEYLTRGMSDAASTGQEIFCAGPKECCTPTILLDFDGTLHVGHAAMDEHGRISLDTGRPLFEFAPLLIELLEPYPDVAVVLTTSWLMTLSAGQVTARLPFELGRRVVGTTRHIKPRLSHILNGSDRTYVIACYAYGASLKHWLAIDDSVFGAVGFGSHYGESSDHYLLLDPSLGISDPTALSRIAQWLEASHAEHESASNIRDDSRRSAS
ncbi:HAD domain-containing protein [Paraburkholderia bannensis]|uniref:HAD domain-containing protein n=1 Tax=Paraburkholderia bannensis TaxID=765414 RepID=UPI002AB7ADBA|nr:HAD domain-containing protein [Paraburkholderia bannensis]